MKISNSEFRIADALTRRGANVSARHSTFVVRNSSAFTLIEIAICLAIISFAILAVIGVLPIGLNTQRDTREETIINQDATMLLEAIRSGSRGARDLANYVTAITITNTSTHTSVNVPPAFLNSGTNIVGFLSTPWSINGVNEYRVIATVRSMSGQAAEKPPPGNAIMLADSFTYKLVCVNYPVSPAGSSNLEGNQHELRMTFLWPLLPNGNVGTGRQTFRATIAGLLTTVNSGGQTLYFYQPQTFAKTNAP